MSIDEAPDSARVLILQFDWQRRLRKVLVRNGPRKPKDCRRAYRCAPGIRRRRIGPSVLHRRTDLDPGWESIEDQTADFVFQDRNPVSYTHLRAHETPEH